MKPSLKIFLGLVIALIAIMVIVAKGQGIRISQLPNTATLNPTDQFLIEVPGVTNKHIKFSQLQTLMPGGSNQVVYGTNLQGNVYVTNLFVTNTVYSPTIITTNLYVTNLYAGDTFTTNLYVTNLYAGDTFTTNLYVTNLYAGDTFTTNLYVTNLYAGDTFITNLYVTNFYAGDTWVTNSYVTNLSVKTLTVQSNLVQNIYYGAGEVTNNTIYLIATNSLADTNMVIDFDKSAQSFAASGTFQLLQTTNRPAEGKTAMAHLRIQNFSGSDIQVAFNTAPGWRTYGFTAPLTVTNGDIATVTFQAWGPEETNVLVGTMNPFH